MNPFARAVYCAGNLLTGQAPESSYYLNGDQMPFSARIMGLLFGLVWGALAAAVVRPRTRSRVLLGVVPMLVDRVLQFAEIGGRGPTNALRLITGVVAGISISLFAAAALSAPREQRAPSPPPEGPGDRSSGH